MIKPVKHSKRKRESLKGLAGQVKYIADPADRNHIGKTVIQGRNHNCSGQQNLHFFLAVARGARRYKKRRAGKRGKRTKRIWEEYVYSSQEEVPREEGAEREACLSRDERGEIERSFLGGPFGGAPVRFGWHIDRMTGRCDCHFLIGAHDRDGVIWTNRGFGKGGKNLKLELERIEESCIRRLNEKRSRERWLRNARQMHEINRRKAGRATLAQKLLSVGWNGKAQTLAEALDKAGYGIHSISVKQVVVQKMDSNRKRPYNLGTLAGNFRKELEKLRSKPTPPRRGPDMTLEEM